MRHIQTYRLFEASQTLTQDQQNFLNQYTIGTWSLNPSTGLVDVEGSFNCSDRELEDFLGVRFGKVSGGFSCSDNSLTSLEGAPKTIGGRFSCSNNKLTSLEGAPETVGGDFYCSDNSLTSLEGAPKTIGGDFYCYSNSLTSLAGAPQTVGGRFSCSDNKLTSLEGAPESVGGGFYSNDLEIPKGKWSMDTFVDLMKTGTPKEQKVVAPLIDPKVLQQQIDQNPEGMLVKLKGVLKHPHFQNLEWPGLEREKDLLSDLDDVGL